ncbi:hypothetical protein IFM89_023197 [Coptis chinensis]|uniref:Deoxyhypusine monooxygenase n=1 Tax=Coptis chinensis TaxID=261450 RepID=A0A835LWV1_9MAGN|nr:hypothetical protein IFM89_023197 [Coptis chinensis]
MALAKIFESSPETEKFLYERLLDQTQPISECFRALFSLRNLRGFGPREALILATRDSSNLLAHEAAFTLGQMQDEEAVPALLEKVLQDLSLHPIVRHEVAEALGAIGLEGDIHLLEKTLVLDPAQEVRETCELALERIEQQKNICQNEDSTKEVASPFLFVDPATPASCCSSVDQLREVLLDEKRGMYQKYAALLALQNRCEDVAVSAIVDSLGARSALLRHENVSEHPMVRHEAAEALGSIADSQSVELLEEFAKDAEPVVSQRCEVALTKLEFERSGKSFEYLFMQTPQVLYHAVMVKERKMQLEVVRYGIVDKTKATVITPEK